MTSGDAVTTWGIGDYPAMAERLSGAAELVVERAEVTSADRVLDVACGTGNAALLAARRGASVVGVDFEPALLAIARDRAGADALEIDWRQDDAVALGLPDAAFTAVVSVFGVMYAADQQGTAQELARCCSPGGRLVLAAWTPGGFMPAMGGVLAPYLPPPPVGGGPPSRWGEKEALAELLEPHGLSLRRASRHSLPLAFADRREAVDFLVRTAGHVRSEQHDLERSGRWTNVLSDLDRLVAEHDEGGEDGVLLSLEYLLAVAVKPAAATAPAA